MLEEPSRVEREERRKLQASPFVSAMASLEYVCRCHENAESFDSRGQCAPRGELSPRANEISSTSEPAPFVSALGIRAILKKERKMERKRESPNLARLSNIPFFPFLRDDTADDGLRHASLFVTRYPRAFV